MRITHTLTALKILSFIIHCARVCAHLYCLHSDKYLNRPEKKKKQDSIKKIRLQCGYVLVNL